MMSRQNLALGSAMLAGVLVLFVLAEPRPELVVEDGPIENMAAAAFAAATLLALVAALRKGVLLTTRERMMLFGTSGLSSILLLSEISFGARIFDLKMPQMSGGGEFDGGHDIVILVYRRLRNAGRTGVLVGAAALAVLSSLALALLFIWRERARELAADVLARPFEFRLVAAVAMLASAVVLDLSSSYKGRVLEEILELAAGVMLILAVMAAVHGADVRGAAARVILPQRPGSP